MFTEKTKLIEKRENPFYGSYKENSILEEIHWQNRRKRQQLGMVVAVVLILVILSIGIILGITLPPLLNNMAWLNPPNPQDFLQPSSTLLGKYEQVGISSDSEICSNLGKTILQDKGGNAVDTAITITLCHGVTNPQSSGLGGGLFMVIYSPKSNDTWTLNSREYAPIQTSKTVFQENPSSAIKGGSATGIPSELSGLWEAHAKFGKLEWSELVRPVRELAESGFMVNPQLSRALKENENKIMSDAILSSEFLNPGTNSVWVEGDIITRTRLASTLKLIETDGASVFYNGTLASDIISELNKAGGFITGEDLSTYQPQWDAAIEYQLTSNLTLYTLGFPSSGPIVAMGLGILHGFGKQVNAQLENKDKGLDEHRLAEVLKFSHAHRSLVVDPDFYDTSDTLDQLLSPNYADQLRSMIDEYKTFDDPKRYGMLFSVPDKEDGTSHISIIGKDGEAVSVTTSINAAFGAGFMGEKTGIIYNNIMNDFSIGNESDVYGLSPNPFNDIEPGKRPGSSMAPLIIVNDQGLPVLASGGAGGEMILSSLISTTWRALYRYMDIKESVEYPRMLPRFEPSEIYYEYGLPDPIVNELSRRGHRMIRVDQVMLNPKYIGAINSVCRTKETGEILSFSDPRKGAGAISGF